MPTSNYNYIHPPKINIFNHSFRTFVQTNFQSKHVHVLIQRLEYWFSKGKFNSGFFKFLEPCKHFLYREGDSWSEELGWKRDLFKKVFDTVGIRYPSKKSYKEAVSRGDVFQGKLYASYYDRKKNQTYFVRNHKFVNDFLSSLSKNGEKPSKKETDVTPQKHSCTTSKSQSFINKDHKLQNNSCRKEKALNQNEDLNLFHQIIGKWEEIVAPLPSHVKNLKKTSEILGKFKKLFHSSLDQWEKYCIKITSSKFLMGETSSKFKIWFLAAFNESFFQRVQEDGFTFGDRTANIPLSVKEKREKIKEKTKEMFSCLTLKEKESYLKSYQNHMKKINPAIAMCLKNLDIRDDFIKKSFEHFIIKKLEEKIIKDE